MITQGELTILALFLYGALGLAIYQVVRAIWSSIAGSQADARQAAIMAAGMNGIPNHRRVRSTLTGSDRRKAQRLLQRTKDRELMEFVMNGNAEWARGHLEAQQLDNQAMLEDMFDEMMLSDDPFTLGGPF